jgi:hypothetical protein
MTEEQKEAVALFEFRQLLMAITDYRRDYGAVPVDLSQLVQVGIMPALPLNPFTGRAMLNVRIDETIYPGDYTYLPALKYEYAKDTRADHGLKLIRKGFRSFLLLGYGSTAVTSSRVKRFSPENLYGPVSRFVIYVAGDVGTAVTTSGPVQPMYEDTAELLSQYGYEW